MGDGRRPKRSTETVGEVSTNVYHNGVPSPQLTSPLKPYPGGGGQHVLSKSVALIPSTIHADNCALLFFLDDDDDAVALTSNRPKSGSAAPYNAGQTFGKPSMQRAVKDTPQNITTTQAGNEWLWDTLANQKMDESSAGYGARNYVRDPATTRTVELRRKGEIPDENKLWQMKQFAGAESKVSTFRTGTAKSRAETQQAEEGLLCTGLMFGQGVRKNPGGKARNL